MAQTVNLYEATPFMKIINKDNKILWGEWIGKGKALKSEIIWDGEENGISNTYAIEQRNGDIKNRYTQAG